MIRAAFLRGMNLGNRRIANAELRTRFERLGFGSVATFQAAGNVVFEAGDAAEEELAATIASGLEEGLGYAVPTVIRGEEELRGIAAARPFPAAVVESSKGKPQVTLLAAAPTAAARDEVLALASHDQLAFGPRELYWLPSGGVSDSDLDLQAIESALGLQTMRTRGTIERLVAKHLPA